MSKYIFKEISNKLNADCLLGERQSDGKLQLSEKKAAKINPNLTVYIYPQEHEQPHFVISTPDGQTCRFDLTTFQPLDQMPRSISKYKHNIKFFFDPQKNPEALNHIANIRKEYATTRATDAPPQSLYRH